MGADNNTDSYLNLYEKIKSIGVKEETEVDELVKNINELANILIDIYLQNNETQGSGL